MKKPNYKNISSKKFVPNTFTWSFNNNNKIDLILGSHAPKRKKVGRHPIN